MECNAYLQLRYNEFKFWLFVQFTNNFLLSKINYSLILSHKKGSYSRIWVWSCLYKWHIYKHVQLYYSVFSPWKFTNTQSNIIIILLKTLYYKDAALPCLKKSVRTFFVKFISICFILFCSILSLNQLAVFYQLFYAQFWYWFTNWLILKSTVDPLPDPVPYPEPDLKVRQIVLFLLNYSLTLLSL